MEVIAELEWRTFNTEKKKGLSRPAIRVETRFPAVVFVWWLKQSIRLQLTKVGRVTKTTTDTIIEIISQARKKKQGRAREIRQIVAI